MLFDDERFLQTFAQPLGDANGIRGIVDIVQQHRELVTTQPRECESVASMGHGVVGSQARLQTMRDFDEQAIGDGVPEAVVHRLESIETENDQRELIIVAPAGAADCALEQVEEQDAVGQTGETVGQLCFGNVGERTGKPCGNAGRISNRGGAAEHPPVAPVAMPQPVLVLVMAVASRDVLGDRLPHARPVILMQAIEPFVRGDADFRILVPEHRLPARRPVNLVGREVPVPQAIVGAVDGKGVALLALAQALDHPLVRQVGADAGEGDRAVDGLGQVVVRAKVEGFDNIGTVCSRGQHDDRQVSLIASGADIGEHLEAVHARHFDIQNYEVVLARIN